eukprot:TRINITY_DN20198_c0_g1_i1.p2 TRINITY_DN20198_c0_g1~~TRINITY_DN20198_c0_g1_i1.p2  ORF type:complete len:107 (-),score=30.82 TRINITY_DN20198_c0_g1_i1:335-655(-)
MLRSLVGSEMCIRDRVSIVLCLGGSGSRDSDVMALLSDSQVPHHHGVLQTSLPPFQQADECGSCAVWFSKPSEYAAEPSGRSDQQFSYIRLIDRHQIAEQSRWYIM